ncbi:MAG: hypothetical protein LBV44_10225 [Methylobacillus sp.]|jgi:hypothetical protein|nr:hypothetical protein [Methylobacillus sp.]
MQIITSGWLRRMVMKSAATPMARIIALFSILQDWLDAPGLRAQLLAADFDGESHRALAALLRSLVADAGFNEPEKLAAQLSFILIGALNAELRNPGCQAMTQAGNAAAGLLAASKPARITAPRVLAAASVAFAVLLTGLFFIPHSSPTPPPISTARIEAAPRPVEVAITFRPDLLSAIYQMHERLRSGQCSYPQALMMAASQRAMFLEGVVNIEKLNTATADLEEVSRLYQQISCSYAPAAMLL